MTLVQRLRFLGRQVAMYAGDKPEGHLEYEAADELERLQQRVEVLEGALRRIADGEVDMMHKPTSEMQDIARAALGEGR